MCCWWLFNEDLLDNLIIRISFDCQVNHVVIKRDFLLKKQMMKMLHKNYSRLMKKEMHLMHSTAIMWACVVDQCKQPKRNKKSLLVPLHFLFYFIQIVFFIALRLHWVSSFKNVFLTSLRVEFLFEFLRWNNYVDTYIRHKREQGWNVCYLTLFIKCFSTNNSLLVLIMKFNKTLWHKTIKLKNWLKEKWCWIIMWKIEIIVIKKRNSFMLKREMRIDKYVGCIQRAGLVS